jgi:hypothetical protein
VHTYCLSENNVNHNILGIGLCESFVDTNCQVNLHQCLNENEMDTAPPLKTE